MKILGIDTTTRFMSIGIYDDHSVRHTSYGDRYNKIAQGVGVYAYNLEAGRRLSCLLAPSIKRILDALGWKAGDIDYFACGLGPGSFTGMRVGLATIKGMSWALKKPLIGISTLDILARNVNDARDPIVPIIDAKRKLIYCSVYKMKNGRLRKIRPYMLLTEKEFFSQIRGSAIIIGDAINLYREKISLNIKGATVLDSDYWYPKGHNIITLALERIGEKKFHGPFDIKPIYLYPKECQIKSYKVTSQLNG